MLNTDLPSGSVVLYLIEENQLGKYPYICAVSTLIIIAIIVFLINVPFGYWRANVRRFSWQWFLSIHIPVAIVIALRILTDVGFQAYTYVVLVSAFVLGQQTGLLVIKWLRKVSEDVTSCMVVDLIRLIRK